jgi:rhamnosyltransferase
VIVTWRPGPGFHELIETVVSQVRRFVVVDNHSSAEEVAHLRALCVRHGGELIANTENRGVAEAINQGLAWVRAQEGAAWSLLFDQDTQPYSTLLCELAAVHAAYPEPERVGILAPNLIERGTGRLAFGEDLLVGTQWVERDAAITSGALLSLQAVERCGAMREELFIDMVDFEFCFRLQAHGYRIVASPKALMLHSVGQYERRRFAGVPMWVTNHSPERRYYLTRNEVVVMREQWRTRPQWVRALLDRRAREVMKILLVEDKPVAKLGMIARGVWDGLRGNFDYSPLRGEGS